MTTIDLAQTVIFSYKSAHQQLRPLRMGEVIHISSVQACWRIIEATEKSVLHACVPPHRLSVDRKHHLKLISARFVVSRIFICSKRKGLGMQVLVNVSCALILM